MKKIFFLLIVLISISGCYNYNDLQDLALVSAVSIDKKDNLYEIGIQVINTQNASSSIGSSANTPKFAVYNYESNNIQEAFRNLIQDNTKRVYAAHVMVFFIGEDIIKNSLDDIMDFFFRSTQANEKVSVIVVKDTKALDALKVLTPIETLNSKSILDSLKANNIHIGSMVDVNLLEFIDSYLDNKKDIFLPNIIIKQNNEGDDIENIETSDVKSEIILNNMCYLSNNKNFGYLDKSSSILFNILNNNTVDVLKTIYIEDKYIVYEIKHISSSIKYKNNKVSIDIKAVATINEITYDINLQNPDNNTKLTKMLNNTIEDEIKEFIKSSNELEIDILELKNTIYKDNPKYYKMIKDNFFNYAKDYKYDINSDITINSKGNLIKVTK